MRIGPKAIELIKEFEGCKLRAYRCPAGIWTIGYGATGAGIVQGLTWSQAQAEARLRDDLAAFEGGVTRAIAGAATSPAQFGAMVSLAFNIGIGAFSSSSVARLHREGDHKGAADAFLMWNKGGGQVLPGLVRRRLAERTRYLAAA